MRYSQDRKKEALARIAEIGVKNASEELGISVPTLYKWRNARKDSQLATEAPADEWRQILIHDQSLEEKIKRLEDQNNALRDENKQLRERVAQMKRALIAWME